MTRRLRFNRIALPLAIAVPVLAATACGGSDSAPTTAARTTASTTTTAPAGETAPAGAVEHDDPRPRLLVADFDTSSVEVVDLVSGRSFHTFVLAGPASLTPAGDGRYAYAAQHDADTVDVLDGGAWTVDHGDHFHHYTAAPEIAVSLDGARPVHVVSNEGLGAVFFDGSGTAALLDEDTLGDDEPAFLPTLQTGKAHHGVAVPFAGHVAITLPDPKADEGALPRGTRIAHSDGEIEATYATCPDLHGEAAVSDAVVFACANGLLAVAGGEGAWHATKAPYPKAGGGDGRAWTLIASERDGSVAGVLGARGIVIYRPGEPEARALELPQPISDVAADDETGLLVALTVDGRLHLVDPASGQVAASAKAIEPFAIDFERPLPQVIVAGTRAYVSDPGARAVVEVALNDGLRIARTLATGVLPGSIALVGA